jgi:xanthine/CO dehydrogenase XdhC/CoxF family maturation factor
MRELKQIVEAFEYMCFAGERAALATVTAVEGSSYRKPGARMLIAADGRTWGTVSGGCLENDVARRGRIVIDSGAAEVCGYETSEEEDTWVAAATPGPTLGCGGRIELVIEPVSAKHPGAMTTLCAVVRERRAAAMVGNIDEPELRQAISQHLRELSGGTAMLRLPRTGGFADVLLERLAPPQAIAIFGDGQDVQPLAEMAQFLGWHVMVIGMRAADALRQRFGGAVAVVSASADDPTAGMTPLPQDTAVVIMAHHLQHDAAVLRHLLKSPPKYVGILGSRRRTQRLLELAGAGDAAGHPWLYAPVGLDVGAQTPDQIALAIVAEIQAVMAARGGGPLRQRSGPIHVPAPPSSIGPCPA